MILSDEHYGLFIEKIGCKAYLIKN